MFHWFFYTCKSLSLVALLQEVSRAAGSLCQCSLGANFSRCLFRLRDISSFTTFVILLVGIIQVGRIFGCTTWLESISLMTTLSTDLSISDHGQEAAQREPHPSLTPWRFCLWRMKSFALKLNRFDWSSIDHYLVPVCYGKTFLEDHRRSGGDFAVSDFESESESVRQFQL